jgi:hypothetical protein
MTRYVVRYENVPLTLSVHVNAESPEEAEALAWTRGEAALEEIGNSLDISVDATLDGLLPAETEEVEDE